MLTNILIVTALIVLVAYIPRRLSYFTTILQLVVTTVAIAYVLAKAINYY